MNEELDRFADELDRMIAGQGPAGDGDLAAFAREVQGVGAERIIDEQRERIRWRLTQHAMSASIPTTGGAGPLRRPALADPAMSNPWVCRTPASAAPSGWRGHVVKAQAAIAIMTAVALLIVGGAWYTSQQDGDGPLPSATRHAAAPTQDAPGNGEGATTLGVQALESSDNGTPNTLQEDLWVEPISAEECLPRENPADADAVSRSPGDVERAYGPLTTPSVRDGADAAMTLRRYQACLMANGDADGYVSDRFTVNSATAAPRVEEKLRAAQQISEGYQDIDRDEFTVIGVEPESTPPSSMRITELPGVYQPQHARELPDGRITLPSSRILPVDYVPILDRHVGNVYILAQTDGGWVVDDMLLFCVGDCDDFWTELERVSSANSTPPATPGAIAPMDDRIWLACPGYNGPYTLAARDVVASDVAPTGAFNPRSSWGPAEPPSIPCQYPEPQPPEIGNPIPLN